MSKGDISYKVVKDVAGIQFYESLLVDLIRKDMIPKEINE